MNKTIFFLLIACVLISAPRALIGQEHQSEIPADETIFIYGGGMNKAFINYVAQLTNKPNPKICFLPTASADNIYVIAYWYELCADLPVEPHVMQVWISSYSQRETFDEILLKMDAIIVGGGNTLNMIALWEAQGIDSDLNKALQKGIILAGGSAGSLCWFKHGTTDSRPKELSTVEGLGFLNYSHCPHYNSEESRRPLYHEKILSGEFISGYACDDSAGIVFRNGKFSKSVSLNKDNNSYYVSLKNGEVEEIMLESEIIEY